jgi:hypothetical protein
MITGPGAAPRVGVHALELTRLQGVVLDRHGQPPDRRVERGALGHGPGAQHRASLDAQIEVQCGRVVKLDDEPGCGHLPDATGCQ